MSTISVTIVPDPPAARLRLKGGTLRLTMKGVVSNYRVVSVSMPDEFGRCTVEAEPVSPRV